jgi:peroxiredoxin Q/BCP
MADPDAGDPAPEFELANQDGETVRRSDLEGDPLVLFFYPKDHSPVCTREVCQFRDAFEDLRDLDATVVGVSQDPPDEHARFREEHDLPFDLLSDEDGEVAEAYGVDGFLATRRTTFVIDANGTIVDRTWSPLPGSHVKGALAALEETPHA